jgi:hypothetical protein
LGQFFGEELADVLVCEFDRRRLDRRLVVGRELR